MKRLPDWEQRLHEAVTANLTRPHVYGEHDCLLWPAAVIEALTGEDLGKKHRGKYDSHAKAYRHLGKMGFDSPTALLDSLFDEKPIGFAGRGDVVLVHTESGDNPGIVMGGFALVVGEQGTQEGLIRAPRALWLKAWAIGEHHSGDFS